MGGDEIVRSTRDKSVFRSCVCRTVVDQLNIIGKIDSI